MSDTVSSRLQEAREMAGLSVGQAAKLLGVERATILQAEADDTAALAICRAALLWAHWQREAQQEAATTRKDTPHAEL